MPILLCVACRCCWLKNSSSPKFTAAASAFSSFLRRPQLLSIAAAPLRRPLSASPLTLLRSRSADFVSLPLPSAGFLGCFRLSSATALELNVTLLAFVPGLMCVCLLGCLDDDDSLTSPRPMSYFLNKHNKRFFSFFLDTSRTFF